MNNFKQEIAVTVIFLLVLLVLLNPLGLYMPTELIYIILGSILVLFGVYASLILKESPQDEREELHLYIANRFAYIYGSLALVVGIIYQGITDAHIDPWLLLVLAVLVVSKMLSLLHSAKMK